MKNYLTIAWFVSLIIILCILLVAKWDVIGIGQKIFTLFFILIDLVCIAGSAYNIKKGDK